MGDVPNGRYWTNSRCALICYFKLLGSPTNTKAQSIGQANHFRVHAQVRSDYAIKRYLDETKRLYSVLESRLKESAYLVGEKYTIADIANFTWVRAGPSSLEIDLSEFPALQKWVETIDQREAVQNGSNVPQLNRSPEQMAENFKKSRARIDAMDNSDLH